MDLSKVKLFVMMKNRLSFLSERQNVLAQNIANANTPGYKPKDLKQVDFREMVGNSSGTTGLKTTHPGHVSSLGSSSARFKTVEQKNTFETTPTGNAVVLEEQMMKMAENQMDYQTTTSIYKKIAEMMRLAAGGGGR